MSASFTVRRAKQSDHDALGALWMAFMSEQAGLDDRLAVADDARERWDNDFSVWLNDERQATFVAEVDDALRGFATAHQWGPPPIYEDAVEVYLDELYVAPEARRSGLGEKLVAAVRTWGLRLAQRAFGCRRSTRMKPRRPSGRHAAPSRLQSRTPLS
jgi:GNAT superfamily N-acetyltransferase